MKGLGHLEDDDVVRAGMVVKRAVSAKVWKNWRPRFVVLRMGSIEWYLPKVNEGVEIEDLPAGLMRLRPTTECCAGGERAHCLTLCTSGRVLQLNPDTLALTRTPTRNLPYSSSTLALTSPLPPRSKRKWEPPPLKEARAGRGGPSLRPNPPLELL